MSYTIEADIPLPTEAGAAPGGKRSYPFEHLDVGHSFAVPFAEGPSRLAVIRRVATACARRHAAEKERRYTWQAGVTHIRVWRVA